VLRHSFDLCWLRPLLHHYFYLFFLRLFESDERRDPGLPSR
jgi:hypothetical protein